jgi:hypothetical protein
MALVMSPTTPSHLAFPEDSNVCAPAEAFGAVYLAAVRFAAQSPGYE